MLRQRPRLAPGCESLIAARAARPAARRRRGPAPASALTPRRAALLGSMVCACAGCRSRSAWYDRYFAYAMSKTMATYERAIQPVKARLFEQLLTQEGGLPREASLLEVGVGTGPNLSYYAPAAAQAGLRITGLDPNAAMQRYARDNAQAAGLPAASLDLVEGSAEALPFEAGTFDALVCTLVLCSVPDPLGALQEMRRVLGPGGRLLLVEHVVAPNPGWMRLGQQVFNPVQRAVADGCNLTRDTGATMAEAGWDTAALERFEVPGLSILAPHIAGVLAR